METFLRAGRRGLKARTEDEQAAHEREVRELRAKIGELGTNYVDFLAGAKVRLSDAVVLSGAVNVR